ncbi:Fc.00g028160.m01.CDS01 [Cosmosporella sp. VM-42]
MADLKSFRGEYYLWKHVPSRAAAIVFVILFSIVTGFIIWKIFRSVSRYCIPFAIGGLFEIIGYCARAVAEDKTDVLLPYVIQSLFILLAPAFFAATIYMTLGRLMRNLKGERHSLIPVRWLTTAFVCGDVLSFFIQGSGAGVMVSGKGSMEMGQNIIIGGLFIQIITFGLFGATAAMFHVGMKHWPSGPSLNPHSAWRRTMKMLYAVSALVMARSLFRAVEYILGPDGYALTHEWTLYVFDAALMLSIMVVFAGWFPRDEAEPDADDGWRTMDARRSAAFNGSYRIS